MTAVMRQVDVDQIAGAMREEILSTQVDLGGAKTKLLRNCSHVQLRAWSEELMDLIIAFGFRAQEVQKVSMFRPWQGERAKRALDDRMGWKREGEYWWDEQRLPALQAFLAVARRSADRQTDNDALLSLKHREEQ